MKVLLTGSSGFIGGKILDALLKKYNSESVIVLTSKDHLKAECVLYKSTNFLGTLSSQFDDVTHIIHAGAFIPKESSQANCIDSCFSNVEYTKNLLGHDFRNLERFINLSTIDVYKETISILTENSCVSPVSLYGFSKLYCEEMIKRHSEKFQHDYLNLRIGHVYGPGEEEYKKVLPSFIQMILSNRCPEIWGDGTDLRSFIFIEDVVDSVLKSLTVPQKDIDINVVSAKSVSIMELLQLVISISGGNFEPRKSESNHIGRDLVFDNTLLLNTLLKKETDLEIGVAREYEYMKALYENSMRS